MAILTLHNVIKRFGGRIAVDSLSLEIRQGEFLILLGPTGAGKTTTLRLIAGLEKPDEGEIRVDGLRMNDSPPAVRDVAMVFQTYSLYPHFTVRQNLAFPLQAPGRNLLPEEINQKVLWAANLLGVSSLLDRKPVNLSGGEQQRVTLGRAIVRSPKIFLMDEPLSALDAKLRERMRVEIKVLQKKLGTTTLYVTHDQSEALGMADRIAVIHQGKLQQVGAPNEIYYQPANTFVASFVGQPRINLLPVPQCPGNLFEGFPSNGKAFFPSSAQTVGIRPESIQLNQAGHGQEARILVVQHLGPEKMVLLEMEGQEVIATSPHDFPLAQGQIIRVRVEPIKLLFFDAQGNLIPR